MSILMNWLDACINGEVGQHFRLLGINADMSDLADERQQLKWIKSKDWNKVASYGHIWKGKAAVEFLKKAPEGLVKEYLFYSILNEEQQIALIKRDIKNRRRDLIYEYFHFYFASPKAQKLIQQYDRELWKEVIMQNYGWLYEYERKFGCLTNWQRKIRENIEMLADTPAEKITEALNRIS